MDKLQRLTLVAALGLASVALAQTQTSPEQQTSPETMPPTTAPPPPSEAPPAPSTEGSTSGTWEKQQQGTTTRAPQESSPQTGQQEPRTSPGTSEQESGSSQQQGQTGQTDQGAPETASSPHQRSSTGQTGTSEASPTAGDEPSDASSPHQRQATGEQTGESRTAAAGGAAEIVGKGVESATGEKLGSVVNVMVDSQTQTPAYVIIEPADAAGQTAAVPYEAVSAMMQDDVIVMERSKLHGAPKVEMSTLQDPSQTAWQSEADAYWGREGATRSAGEEGGQQPRG